jgi:hypothetical protein
MWTEPRTSLDGGTANALRAHRYVVDHGIRHVPIDVLPREPLTFRTICGKDITADELPSAEQTDCKWCRHFEGLLRVLVDPTGATA